MSLHSGQFRGEDLIKVYSPPSLASVMPGNHVMLKSGGPDMIVADQDTHGNVLCHWMDENNQRQEHSFNIALLTCYGAK